MNLSQAAQKAFFASVWKLVRLVPPGKVTTYGQIAEFIPAPAGVDPLTYLSFRARWVGTAMAACPENVPWQRVINAQGKISARQGAESQRLLLEAEGVRLDERGKINLKVYGWEGPSLDWLRLNDMAIPQDYGLQEKLL